VEVHVDLRDPDATAGADGGDPRPEPAIDPPLDDVPPESAEPEGRRYPSTLGGIFYLVVLGVSAVGLAVVSRGDWRLGVRWIAGALVFAAVVRLVIPAPQAGMLAVRRRSVDVVILVAIGAALWFLSSSIPNQPVL
jgi:cation transport ATPase